MDWWVTAVAVLFGMGFLGLILNAVLVSQMRRAISLNVVLEYYNWMHAQPEFRSFNRVQTGKDRELMYAWTIAYVKYGKNHETERAYSPKMAIRMFKEAIQ